MEKSSEIYTENDKWQAPFLLAATFQKLLEFQGSIFNDGVLRWQFSPKSKAEELLDKFRTKTEPHIPAKDLFEATETWWREISEMKNGGIPNGSHQAG